MSEEKICRTFLRSKRWVKPEVGKVEGKVELIGLLLAHQVGEISAETVEDIKKLPIEQLDRLALDLRGFKSIVDLTNWLKQKN